MIQHFIITRFSYRGNNLNIKKGQDPLKPENLEHRFNLFEIGCLPGILNQKNQDFTWIIIVDPELPANYRTRLQKLISPKRDCHLVNFSRQLVIYNLTWLNPWIKAGTKYVINTVIDDDDMLFNDYTRYLSDYLTQQQQLEPITFFACSNELSWDFYSSKQSPFGYLKAKHTHYYPAGAGYAVCCKYPEINFSILSFEHTAFNYLSTDCEGFNKLPEIKKTRIEHLRKIISEEINKSKIKWEGRLTAKNFHYITSENTQVIVINHFGNIQFLRIFADFEMRKPVKPDEFVPGFFVDFNLVEKHISKYYKSLWLLLMLIKSNFIITPNYLRNASSAKLFYHRLLRLRKIISGFRKLN
jgi:hypothetical protein